MARRRKKRQDPVESLLGLGVIIVLLGAMGAWQNLEQYAWVAVVVGAAVAVGLVAVWRHRRAARLRFETTLDGFLALSPTEFEVEVGKVLEAAGYGRMQRVGGAGDLSIDVRGRDATGRTVLVQCKRYAPGKRIGSPAIQQFYGMCHYHDPAALPIFVTTADYTADARKVAEKAGVRLVDGPDLVALALQARAMAGPGKGLVEAPPISPSAQIGR